MFLLPADPVRFLALTILLPLLFCSRARFSRMEQLSLKRRRRVVEEEEAEVADAEVALCLDTAYQVRSSEWAGGGRFGLPFAVV